MNQDVAIDASLKRLGGSRFNTNSQPERHRHEWLREIIGRKYAHVDVKPPQGIALFNDMQIYPMHKGIRFSPIRSNPIQLQRLPAEPLTISHNCFFAVLLLSGSYKLEQGGRETFLQPGDMTIYDATEPHQITLPEAFSKLIISVPREYFEAQFLNLNHLTATKIASKHHAQNVHMLSHLCQQMHFMDKTTFHGFSEPILDILTESIIESGGIQRDISTLKALSLFRVKHYIQLHLANESLDAEQISQGVRLSVRYINELFQHQGTSLMRFVTEKRLEQSHHYLTNTAFANLSITEIALRCGFKNFSHFSRVFKASYSHSPRAYRQIKMK